MKKIDNYQTYAQSLIDNLSIVGKIRKSLFRLICWIQELIFSKY